MTQQTLFDPHHNELTPIARNTDPQTSHQAAEEIDVDDCKAVAHWAAHKLTESQGDATAREIAELAVALRPGRDKETYRKRVGELAADRLLTKCGTRKCSVTGKMATTFKGA